MEVSGQAKLQQQPMTQNVTATQVPVTNPVSAQQAPQAQVCQPCQPAAQQPVQASYPVTPVYYPPQNTVYPQYHPTPAPQGQNIQVPASAAGVNIQIFNPSVATPGAQAPTYNVNAPCYPASYYTGSVGADGKMHPNGNNNGYSGGNTNSGAIDGNVNTGTNNGTIGNNNNNSTYTTNNNTTSTTVSDDKKKTEKRKIVQLTDDYIRNLETYLNSQEKDVRLSAAKEVYARLEEDDSRKDDKALTALINKMLQDPSTEIRILALSALESRMVTGDDYSVGVLQKMQQNPAAYGQDAVDATNILLKMSGKQVEKEFEVKDDKKKETKTETTQTTIKSQQKK